MESESGQQNEKTKATPPQDWDPLAELAEGDQRTVCDRMRETTPVAYSEAIGWSLFRHGDVTRVLDDPETFSNAVSRHLSVPNGMDPPHHTEYRRIIEPYFSTERMRAFEAQCREIAADLAQRLAKPASQDLIGELARPFAARVQCAFLGWPQWMEQALSEWYRKNEEATRSRDREAQAAVAEEFSGYIKELLEERRAAGGENMAGSENGRTGAADSSEATSGTEAPSEQDITADLMQAQVQGHPLSDEEIVSIIRNWTAGEIGTITASVGILAEFLASHQEIQKELRSDYALLPEAIDEILRLNGPLFSNRRVATRRAEIGGRTIEAGDRISLIWIAANRYPRVFEEPERFRWGRNRRDNLLFGRGIHVCPARPLAHLELRVVLEELFRYTETLAPGPVEPRFAHYPGCGFEELPLRVE